MNYYSNYYFNKYASAQQGFTVPSSYLNAPNYEYLLKTAGMWDDIKQWGKDRAWDALTWDIRNHPNHAANMLEQMRGKDLTSVGAWWDAFKGATKTSINNKLGIKEDNGGNKGTGGNSNDNWSKYLPLLGLAGGGALLGGALGGGWGGTLMGGLGLPVAAWAIQQYMNQNKQKGSNSNSSGSSWFGSSNKTQNQAPQSRPQGQQSDPRVQQLQQAVQDPVDHAQNVAQQRYNQVMSKNPPQRMVGNKDMQGWQREGTPITMPSNYLGNRNGNAPFSVDTNNASGLRFTGDQMTKQQIDEQRAINGMRQANALGNYKKYRDQLEAQKDQMTPEEYASKMKRLDDRYAMAAKRNVANQKDLGTVAKEQSQSEQQTDKRIRENRVGNAKAIVNTARK